MPIAEAWPRTFAVCLVGLFIFASMPTMAQSACGTPTSPPACLAPCAGNQAMVARRQALAPGINANEPDALYQTGQSWLGIGDESTAPVCRPDAADHRMAAQFFRRAAATGHVEAQVALGDFWELGLGGEKDYFRAFDRFHAAAAQKHPRALFRVGVFHDFGRATNRKDPAIAALWYAEAARRGSCDARFALATMYRDGRGVGRNPRVAWALYRLVVADTYTVGCYGRGSGDAARFAKSLAAQMSPTDLAGARREFARWAQP